MINNNPLLGPYSVPPFDQLKAVEFEPALDKVIADAKVTLDQIKQKPASFENTVVPLNALLGKINEIKSLFDTYEGATDVPKKITEAFFLKASAFEKSCFQDPVLGALYRSVPTPSDEQDRELYKYLAFDFEGQGAFLSAKDRQKLSAIDNELITSCNAFDKNIKAGIIKQSMLFKDVSAFTGLPEDKVTEFKKNAQDEHKDGWLVIPDLTLLEFATNRSFRKQIYDARNLVGADNESVVLKIQHLRNERARLLGYKDYAEYALRRTMAGESEKAENLSGGTAQKAMEKVQKFLDGIEKKAIKKFETTFEHISEFARNNGQSEPLEPYDFAYWVHRYKEKEFGYNKREADKYLELNKVIKGYFETTGKIFDVTFHENTSYPKLHRSVTTYDVFDNKTHEHLGIIHADLFARKGKVGGASANPVQYKNAAFHRPKVVVLKMNLTEPQEGKPMFLSMDDVETLFHEGGHIMHQLLGARARYALMQGADSSPDYAEIHSKLLQEWIRDPVNLKSFASNQKGEAIPNVLLEAAERAKTFAAEYGILKSIQNSRLDLAFHSAAHLNDGSTRAIEEMPDFKHPLKPFLRPVPLTRFDHLFSSPQSAYAAGYFGYLNSDMYSRAAYKTLSEEGMFSPEVADRMKDFYSAGAGYERSACFERLNGGPPAPVALLESIGIYPELHRLHAQEPKTGWVSGR